MVEAMRGLGHACREMNTPVISGNVSLYNETDGNGIHPTPTVGMVGLIEPADKALAGGFKGDGDTIAILGKPEGSHLGGSTYLHIIHGLTQGTPQTDSEAERRYRVPSGWWSTAWSNRLTMRGWRVVALVEETMGPDAPGFRVSFPEQVAPMNPLRRGRGTDSGIHRSGENRGGPSRCGSPRGAAHTDRNHGWRQSCC